MKKIILLPVVMLLTCCSSTKVTLLPDMTGHVGNVIVKNDGGLPVTLVKSGQTIGDSILGGHESELSPEEARQEKPALFAAEPAPLTSQTVWFNNDSVKPQSSRSQIINRVKNDCLQREPCQITIIGHTDSMGSNRYNMDLSLRRALVVKRILLRGGFQKEAIDVRYHGPFDPLIKTSAGKPQPKNRRVEIMVH